MHPSHGSFDEPRDNAVTVRAIPWTWRVLGSVDDQGPLGSPSQIPRLHEFHLSVDSNGTRPFNSTVPKTDGIRRQPRIMRYAVFRKTTPHSLLTSSGSLILLGL